jgi:hypothetical protein
MAKNVIRATLSEETVAVEEPVSTPADNTATPMVVPFVEGVSIHTLITIGEAATQSTTDAANGDAYIPVGIPDGQGVIDLGDGIIRLFTNSEVGRDKGYAYTLANGLELTGARVNYMDIDTATNTVINGGLAYDTIIDRKRVEVSDAQQINWQPDGSSIAETAGFDRFCSANLVKANAFGNGRGFEDNIFLLGEETSPDFPPTVRDGTFQALDIANETLYAAPDLGYGSWESGTLLDTGRDDKVAVVLGDDYTDAPIWLYIGEKDTSAGAGFLERNGLVGGQLYTWVANDGSETPADLFGTGTKMGGTWTPIEVQNTSMAGEEGYDDEGYLLGETLRAEARSAGAFFFSRPEDVDVNPVDGTQFVVNNTGDGDGEVNPTDLFGDVSIFDVDFNSQGNPISADLTILYDGDTPELNGVDSSFKGIRNPDNLAWSADGYIYIQEDFAYDFAPEDAEGLEEASIWRVAPDGKATRIAVIDRDVVLPEGTTDSRAATFGASETSGIIDVSEYYGNPAGTDFYLTVQAHGIRDGVISDLNLVEGGQILHLKSELPPIEPKPGLPETVFGTPDADYFDSAFMDEKKFAGEEQNLFTGSGDDTVDVSVMGEGNRIDTGSGDDLVFAGTNNRIILGAGDDIIFAGSGEGGNNITGGMGADQFWLITDIDEIPAMSNKFSDFKASQGDVIGFANSGLSLANKGSDWNYQQQGSNVFISVDGQEIAQLLNTTITDANFVFA